MEEIKYEEIVELAKRADAVSRGDVAEYPFKPDPSEFPTYKEGTVLDEDKSVKWNREEVARLNKAYDEESIRLRKLRANIYSSTEGKIKEYVAQRCNISIEKASLIWSYIYEEYHSGGYVCCVAQLDDLVDIFVEVLK